MAYWHTFTAAHCSLRVYGEDAGRFLCYHDIDIAPEVSVLREAFENVDTVVDPPMGGFGGLVGFSQLGM